MYIILFLLFQDSPNLLVKIIYLLEIKRKINVIFRKILTLREKHVNIVKNRRIGSRKIVEFDKENHHKSDNKLVK